MALDVFARQGCELAVVEVGLGGRLDATNATDPVVSVISSISYDHTAILGRTLGAIAAEKAGILRSGRRAFLAEQRPAARRALDRACREVGAVCEVVPPLAIEVPLAGAHQRQNAALAVAAARALAHVDDTAVERGLERLRWPGRFEVVELGRPVVLDGAHNGASARALAETLRTHAPGQSISLVVGINRDKDARAVLRPLLAIAERVWATQTADNPRALPATDLARICRRLGAQAQPKADVREALEAALQATSRHGLVCVTGSLLLVGQARTSLGLPVVEHLW
jgi:dihydrofolate synthase/folylpolyglutamate synthase